MMMPLKQSRFINADLEQKRSARKRKRTAVYSHDTNTYWPRSRVTPFVLN